MESADAGSKLKQKRKVLSIDKKVHFLKELESTSATILSEKYGIGKSAIIDIKRNQKQILEFK